MNKPVKRTHPDCHRCQHFYVTWEKQMPFGCRAHGFKSAQLPSIVVYQSSGLDCLLYREKVRARG